MTPQLSLDGVGCMLLRRGRGLISHNTIAKFRRRWLKVGKEGERFIGCWVWFGEVEGERRDLGS